MTLSNFRLRIMINELFTQLCILTFQTFITALVLYVSLIVYMLFANINILNVYNVYENSLYIAQQLAYNTSVSSVSDTYVSSVTDTIFCFVTLATVVTTINFYTIEPLYKFFHKKIAMFTEKLFGSIVI